MNLIVGVDGSDLAMTALEGAADRVRETGGTLTVAIYGANGARESVESAVRERLEELAVDASIEHLDGDAGGALVEHAERGGFDRIVLPGGERSPLGKIQFDSTVEFVLLNARTSVTLIR